MKKDKCLLNLDEKELIRAEAETEENNLHVQRMTEAREKSTQRIRVGEAAEQVKPKLFVPNFGGGRKKRTKRKRKKRRRKKKSRKRRKRTRRRR